MNSAAIKMVQVTEDPLIDVIASLARDIWREHYIPIIGSAQVEYMLDKFQSQDAIREQIKSGSLYYLIRNEKDISVGYLAVLPKGPELFLSKIYIGEKHRGKGYGRQALAFVDRFAGEKGFLKITLMVNKKNKNSIEIYQKAGYRVAESLVQDIGNGFVLDDYQLEKELSL